MAMTCAARFLMYLDRSAFLYQLGYESMSLDFLSRLDDRFGDLS